MSAMPIRPLTMAILAALFVSTTGPALAYAGPGLGFGAVATAFGIISSLLLILLSFIWFPLKRLIRKMRKSAPAERNRP